MDVEDVVGTTPLQIGLAQELLRVGADEQRQVRLLPDEVGIVEPLLHDHVRHGEAQRSVGPDLDRKPQVGVDRRGAVVRGDADDGRTVVASLVDEVGVGDLGVRGIAAPDEDQIRIEEVVARACKGDLAHGRHRAGVVIAYLAVHVEDRRIEHVAGAVGPYGVAAVASVASWVPDDRRGTVLEQRVDGAVCDVAQASSQETRFQRPAPRGPMRLSG